MATRVESILTGAAPRVVAGAATRIAGTAVGQIEATLPRALAGERTQVRAYVRAYRDLTDRVLAAVSQARPDVLVIDGDNRVVVVIEAKGRSRRPATPTWVRAALDQEAMTVPFSDWVGTLGAGRGTAAAVVAQLRSLLPDAEPLAAPAGRRMPNWPLDERDVVRFSRAVLDELARVETPLDYIGTVLGLTQTELAVLFGVRRQALEQWATRGVPPERQEKLANLGEIADLLAAKLKRDRIPGVVRRPAQAYGDRSMLEAIAAGEQAHVLAELRDAFDWAAAA